MINVKNKIIIFDSKKLDSITHNQRFVDEFDINNCSSKEELLQNINSESIPEAIFLDYQTAEDNNFEILKQIDDKTSIATAIKFDQPARIPLIVFMQESITQKEIALLDAGVSDVLLTTISQDILIHRIKNIIRNNRIELEKFMALNFQHKKAIKQLTQLSSKTGIFNKQTFINKTQELLINNIGKTFIFMRFDVDRFKVFNDLFGFAEGDKILDKIGEKLRLMNNHNITYGHIYADHFIMCIEKSIFNPDKVLQEITDYINSLYENFDFIVRIGFNEVYNDGNVNVSLSCDHAQIALQSIKTDFTERYAFYSPSMINDLKQEQELITDMVIGLQKKEFKVYIQPQYDYTTNSLTGAEALVRWEHPKKGLISPGVFIPVFERNGFITQLDKYIWESTCQLLRSWIDEGLNPVPVSVNISRRDIYTPDLVSVFNDLIKKYNLDPRLLRLEITESAYMDNPEQLIDVVQTLQKKGFCLEMDDFGSGYSSLNTLKDVPVDIIKLDMKFIMSATEDLKDKSSIENTSKSGSILSSVVRMANWLKLPIIAEGIESKEQADYLKSIGCFHMQGFYFAKPMPAERYKQLLETLLPSKNENNEKENTIDDSAKFLDATTQNTLLFNDFVGGAVILEWQGSTVEAIRINDKFYEEIGATREDYAVFTKDILSRFEENSKKVFMNALVEATKTRKPTFCEVQSKPIYKGSQPYWIRATIRYLAHTSTSEVFYCAIENINFRMQLLQNNTNLSEQLATIMENIPCGIITLDYDGAFKTSYINENIAKICGFNPSEYRVTVGSDPFLMFSEEDREYYKNYLLDVINSKKTSFSTTANILCKSGKTKTVKISGNLLERSDGTLYISSVIVDLIIRTVARESQKVAAQ